MNGRVRVVAVINEVGAVFVVSGLHALGKGIGDPVALGIVDEQPLKPFDVYQVLSHQPGQAALLLACGAILLNTLGKVSQRVVSLLQGVLSLLLSSKHDIGHRNPGGGQALELGLVHLPSGGHDQR